MYPTDVAVTVHTLSIQGLSYPTAIWTGAAALKRVHSIWQIFTKGNLYLNPDNFFGLISGMTLEKLVRNNLILESPTVAFFITARFLDLFEQEDCWNRSKIKWIEAFKFIQPIYLENPIISEGIPLAYCHPFVWIKVNSKCLVIRVQRIAFGTLDLTFNSFKLIMRVMDIVDIMNMEWTNLANQSVRESGIHVPRVLPVLLNSMNRKMIIHRLEVEKIGLASMGEIFGEDKMKAGETAKNIFAFLDLGLRYYEKASGVCSDVSKAISSLLKRGFYDCSPKFLKQFLQEYRKNDWLKEKNLAGVPVVRLPPLDVLSFEISDVRGERTHVQKPISKKNKRLFKEKNLPPRNVYGTNAIKNSHSSPPKQLTFTLEE